MVEAELLQDAAKAWTEDLRVCRCGAKLFINSESFLDPASRGGIAYLSVACERCGCQSRAFSAKNDIEWHKAKDAAWADWEARQGR